MTLLTVINITGDSITVEFPNNRVQTIDDLKELISKKIGSMPCLFILLCDGKRIEKYIRN